jgi:hypothetical protein
MGSNEKPALFSGAGFCDWLEKRSCLGSGLLQHRFGKKLRL